MQLPPHPPAGTAPCASRPDVVVIICGGLQHRSVTIASALADVSLRSIVVEIDPNLTHHPLSITESSTTSGLYAWVDLGYIAFVILMSPCGTHSVNHHPTPDERLLQPHPVIPRMRYPVAARLGTPGLPWPMQRAVDASNAVVAE